MRFFVELAYDGSPFHGWQKQPNAHTVQEEVERCFAKIFRQDVELVGAGRTDTGVHARQLMAHFDWDETIDTVHLTYKLNRMLHPSILIHKIYLVKSDAHARFDALEREYRYYVSLGKSPFNRYYSYEIHQSVDITAMNKACAYLLNHTDFECFSKVKTDVWTFNCDIKKAVWEKQDNQLVFTIAADRFLRNMVRAIVGTLLEIGMGRRKPEEMQKILNSKDRGQAGQSVAAKGLFLHNIIYPDTIKLN